MRLTTLVIFSSLIVIALAGVVKVGGLLAMSSTQGSIAGGSPGVAGRGVHNENINTPPHSNGYRLDRFSKTAVAAINNDLNKNAEPLKESIFLNGIDQVVKVLESGRLTGVILVDSVMLEYSQRQEELKLNALGILKKHSISQTEIDAFMPGYLKFNEGVFRKRAISGIKAYCSSNNIPWS